MNLTDDAAASPTGYTAGRLTGVVVADSDPLARNAIWETISAAAGMKMLGDASQPEEIRPLLQATEPDVLILDTAMPGLDAGQLGGLSVTGTATPRIIIFARSEPRCILTAVGSAGAAGFLLKELGVSRLPVAVQAVAAGHGLLPLPALMHFAGTPEQTRARQALGLFDTLTPAELCVLNLVALGNSTDEIARSLNITTGTVKSHVSHLLMKLGVRDRVQAVVLAYRTGLVDALCINRG